MINASFPDMRTSRYGSGCSLFVLLSLIRGGCDDDGDRIVLVLQDLVLRRRLELGEGGTVGVQHREPVEVLLLLGTVDECQLDDVADGLGEVM